jgi:hypothetical protein
MSDVIEINGEKYKKVTLHDYSGYSVIRCEHSGAFVGKIKKRNGREVEAENVRRLWYWKGAASLSELAMRGVSKPDECKFPVAVDAIVLLDVIEIIPMTQDAKKTVDSVKIWTR